MAIKNFTQKQITALLKLSKFLIKKYKIRSLRIFWDTQI